MELLYANSAQCSKEAQSSWGKQAETPQILLQGLICPLRLAVTLRMISRKDTYGTSIDRILQRFLQNPEVNFTPLSETMLSGSPCTLTISLIKNVAVSMAKGVPSMGRK